MGLGISRFQFGLPVSDGFVQAGIARDPDHITDVLPFAPTNQPLPTKTGIAADDKVRLWPRRNRCTSSLMTAAACLAPSIRLRRSMQRSIACPQNTYSGKSQ